MTTTCPNCQQPVRAGAKFCGFCGASLMTALEVESTPLPAIQEEVKIGKAAIQAKATGSSSGKANQVVTTVAIILLFLVILISIVIRHWANVSVWLSQILP